MLRQMPRIVFKCELVHSNQNGWKIETPSDSSSMFHLHCKSEEGLWKIWGKIRKTVLFFRGKSWRKKERQFLSYTSERGTVIHHWDKTKKMLVTIFQFFWTPSGIWKKFHTMLGKTIFPLGFLVSQLDTKNPEGELKILVSEKLLHSHCNTENRYNPM